jgi:hypothetical protein
MFHDASPNERVDAVSNERMHWFVPPTDEDPVKILMGCDVDFLLRRFTTAEV